MNLVRRHTAPSPLRASLPALQITGRYTLDFNILAVHETVKNGISAERGLLPSLSSELLAQRRKISQPQTRVERSTSLAEIGRLEKRIAEIESGSRLAAFLARAEPLIAEYRKLGPRVSRVAFAREEVALPRNDERDETDRLRLVAIESYLSLAGEYVSVDVLRESEEADACFGCGLVIEDTLEGPLYCPRCAVERLVVDPTTDNKETARSGTVSRNEYDDCANFRKSFLRHNGQQPQTFPDDLESRLDAYFLSRGRPSCAAIRALPLNARGRRGDTDHKMLYDALGATGLSDYYEDANLIASHIWAWRLPNSMHLEDAIMEDYRKTQAVYMAMSREERGRSSSLGTQYRLFKHLQLRGSDCYKEEFKIADYQDSLEEHERLWQKMCEGAGDPRIYFIPTA